LLDARYRQASNRLDRAQVRLSRAYRHDGRPPVRPWRLVGRRIVYRDDEPGLATDDPDDGAAAEEVRQAQLEFQQAFEESNSLYAEWGRRQQRWPGRLRQEVHRRTGW
jgi:hypothetical protein